MPNAIATTLEKGDRIEVTVAPTNNVRDPRKYGINMTFDDAGYSISKGDRTSDRPLLNLSTAKDLAARAANPEPVFPMAEFQKAIAAGNYAASKGVTAQYEIAMNAYKNGAVGAVGRALPDIIGDAVLEYLAKEHGFVIGASDGRDKAFLDPKQLVVVAPERIAGRPVLWTLQLAPVWGVRLAA